MAQFVLRQRVGIRYGELFLLRREGHRRLQVAPTALLLLTQFQLHLAPPSGQNYHEARQNQHDLGNSQSDLRKSQVLTFNTHMDRFVNN